MRALKKKFKEDLNIKDYEHLLSTSISFEKIPDLKIPIGSNYSSNAKENVATDKKETGVNTGPDIILMLNDLKQSRSKYRKESAQELKNIYKLNNQSGSEMSDTLGSASKFSPASVYHNRKNLKRKKHVIRSMNNFQQVVQSHNPYASKTKKQQIKSKSS